MYDGDEKKGAVKVSERKKEFKKRKNLQTKYIHMWLIITSVTGFLHIKDQVLRGKRQRDDFKRLSIVNVTIKQQIEQRKLYNYF